MPASSRDIFTDPFNRVFYLLSGHPLAQSHKSHHYKGLQKEMSFKKFTPGDLDNRGPVRGEHSPMNSRGGKPTGDVSSLEASEKPLSGSHSPLTCMVLKGSQ